MKKKETIRVLRMFGIKRRAARKIEKNLRKAALDFADEQLKVFMEGTGTGTPVGICTVHGEGREEK